MADRTGYPARPLTVPEVLRRVGHPEGRRHGNRWRTSCPLHHGDNEQAFSYTEQVWHCFRCAESGGARGLAERLGVLETEPERPPPEGVPELRDLRRADRTRVIEKPSARLARLAAEECARVLVVARHLHYLGDQAQASRIPSYLDQAAVTYQNDPDARDAAFDAAARWWREAQRWKDLAHELFIAAAFDPVLAEHDPETACWLLEEARYCLCAGALHVPQGTRSRPRIGVTP